MADNPNTFINEDTEMLRVLIEIRKRLESIDQKFSKATGLFNFQQFSGGGGSSSNWNPFANLSKLSKSISSWFDIGSKVWQQQQKQAGATQPGPKAPYQNVNWFAPAFGPIVQKLGQISNSLLSKAGTSPQQIGNQLLGMYQNLMTKLDPNSNLWKAIFHAVDRAGVQSTQKDVIVAGLENIVGNVLSNRMNSLVDKFEKLLNVVKAAGGDKQAQTEMYKAFQQERRQRIQQNVVTGAKGVANWTSSLMGGDDRIERIGQHVFGGLNKLSQYLPGVLGKVSSHLTSFGEGLFKGVERLRRWNDRLHESDMRFADVSASMAQVMAERQVRDIMLAQERGERRAPSARFREEAISAFEREIAPIEDMFARFQNNIAGYTTQFATSIVQAFKATFPRLAAWMEEPDENADLNMLGDADRMKSTLWLQNIGNRWWDDTYGRPINLQDWGGQPGG